MGSGKKAVVAALAGNSCIAVAKFIAYSFSGSGAMLSEAIHSVADVSNQGLLLLGIERSLGEADENYAYGRGPERYIWTLISAVGIFFLGCGVTVYHGIHVIQDGKIAEPGVWDYSILILSFFIELWTLGVAIKGLNEDRGDVPFFEYLRDSFDPTPVAVFLEDSAACLGLLIALGGIWLSQIFESAIPDGAASILIGLLLGFVAIVLIKKNHGLLIGRSIDREDAVAVQEYLNSRNSIDRILDFKSRVLSAESVRLKMEIEFKGSVIADKVLEGIPIGDERDKAGKDDDAFRAYLQDFADRVIEELGDEVDRIEEDVRAQIPKAKHIDIETD